MMHGLAAGRPERTAVLSTPHGQTRARRLYSSLGFVNLLPAFSFPGAGPAYAIMGAVAAAAGSAAAGRPFRQPEPVVDVERRARAVQRVEVKARRPLGEQPLGTCRPRSPRRCRAPPPCRRRPRASRSASPGGNLAPDSSTTRSSVRMLVTGMIPAMIGTSPPAAATRSRSRR